MAGRKRKQSRNTSTRSKKPSKAPVLPPKKTPLTTIPPNLLIAVLKKCKVKSLCCLRSTCKGMDTFVAENHKKIGIPVTIKLISPIWALGRYERTYEVRAERVTLDFLKESGLRIRKLFVAYNFQDTMIHCLDTILENCLDFIRIPVSVFWFTYLHSCVFDDLAGSPRLLKLISDMPNVKSIRGYLFQEGMQIWWDKYRPDNLNWKMEEIAGPPCWANINRFEKVELYWRDDYLGEHYPARLFRTLIEEWKSCLIALNNCKSVFMHIKEEQRCREFSPKANTLNLDNRNAIGLANLSEEFFMGDFFDFEKNVYRIDDNYLQNMLKFNSQDIFQMFEVKNKKGATAVVGVSSVCKTHFAVHFMHPEEMQRYYVLLKNVQ